MRYLTKFQTKILTSVFKISKEYVDQGNPNEIATACLSVREELPSLLIGKSGAQRFESTDNYLSVPFTLDIIDGPFSATPSKVSTKSDSLAKILSNEICNNVYSLLQVSEIMLRNSVSKNSFESVFISEVEQMLQLETYRINQPFFAEYEQFSGETVIEKAKTLSLIKLIVPHYRNPSLLTCMFNVLRIRAYEISIHLTSVEALRKYISRKESKGLPGSLVHGSIGKPSHNPSVSDFMRDLIIEFATMVPRHRSAQAIHDDLDFLLRNMTDPEAYGVYPVSIHWISKFIASPEAIARIAYAKENPLEFKQRFIGVLRFARASAPLIRIYIDGYSFQLKVLNDDTGKEDTLVGIFITDDHSSYCIACEIGDAEDKDLLVRTLESYFEKVKDALPHEIVMDRYTYRILKKSLTHIYDFLIRMGVKITPTSHPNAKRIERFFRTFQEKILHHLLHYIGSGIKSKSKYSHPPKAFLLALKTVLASKFDMIPVLKRLVKNEFNRHYQIHQDEALVTPEYLFQNLSHLKIATENQVRSLFYDLHQVTFRGAGVTIQRDENLHIYLNRDFKVITTYHGVSVDAYVHRNDTSKIFIYRQDSFELLITIDELAIIPVSDIDRTEQDKFRFKELAKQAREVLQYFKDDSENRTNRIIRTLKFHPKDRSKIERLKKQQSSEEELRKEMDYAEDIVDPPKYDLYDSAKGRRKGKTKNALEGMGIHMVGTI